MLRIAGMCAVVLAITGVFFSQIASAQANDLLISPSGGAAGSRLQVVGQAGWSAGESVRIDVAFADVDPAVAPPVDFYEQGSIMVLRDGTWSFPLVVNRALFPFPLYRPGFIVVRAQSASKTSISAYVYTVEGRRPLGAPPLASLGAGPFGSERTLPIVVALFAAGVGALVLACGRRGREFAIAGRRGAVLTTRTSIRDQSPAGSDPG